MISIKNFDSRKTFTFTSLFLLMCLTRGDHLLTSLSLPDASFALFLICGMLLNRANWFIALFRHFALWDSVGHFNEKLATFISYL